MERRLEARPPLAGATCMAVPGPCAGQRWAEDSTGHRAQTRADASPTAQAPCGPAPSPPPGKAGSRTAPGCWGSGCGRGASGPGLQPFAVGSLASCRSHSRGSLGSRRCRVASEVGLRGPAWTETLALPTPASSHSRGGAPPPHDAGCSAARLGRTGPSGPDCVSDLLAISWGSHNPLLGPNNLLSQPAELRETLTLASSLETVG